jgi:2'-5' RNA ligase
MKRLFFGAEITAPSTQEPLSGRLIDPTYRHLTLAFLGNTSFSKLEEQLSLFPKPVFRVGLVGVCDRLLFLPPEHSRVVAGHVSGLEKLKLFHDSLSAWLEERGYPIDRREFLPHVSLARAPFDPEEWEKQFTPFPVVISAIHLYESTGNLNYVPLWSYPLLPPFEEFAHTADIAFHIRGASLPEIHLHAQIALAFKFPPLLAYFAEDLCSDLDDIIIALNATIARADQEAGCPFKAVSFHGKVVQDENKILHWEMIVDV